MARKLTATTPRGTFTRSTERNYSHVVVLTTVRQGATPADVVERIECRSWASSLVLAEKAAASLRRIWSPMSGALIAEGTTALVEIFPVDQAAAPAPVAAEIADQAEDSTPVVGMGATMQVGTDQYPATVIAVSPSGKTVRIQADQYRRSDANGQSESQTYLITEDPKGATFTARLDKWGTWRAIQDGDSTKYRRPVFFGHRRAYRDPSF